MTFILDRILKLTGFEGEDIEITVADLFEMAKVMDDDTQQYSRTISTYAHTLRDNDE